MCSFIIGITGPIGSGKTTVCEALKENGILIIDADSIAREELDANLEYIESLKKEFGKKILTNEKIDRESLANVAFSSKEGAQKLNKIALPFIMKNIKERVEKAKNKGFKFIAIDAPLLFEAGLDEICSVVISVVSDIELRKNRAIKRGNIRKEDIVNRISIQPKDEFYINKSNYVLYNNKDKEDLNKQARNLVAKIMEKFNEK